MGIKHVVTLSGATVLGCTLAIGGPASLAVSAPEARAEVFAASYAVPAEPSSASAQQLTIGYNGLGRARIGTSMDTFARALRMHLYVDADSPTSPCWIARVGPSDLGIWVLTSRGRRGGVERVSVESDMGSRVDGRRAPKTDKGIGIGSRISAVRRAYRGKLRESMHEYVPAGRYLDVKGPRGTAMRFETNGRGRVTAIHTGRAAQVGWVEHCL